MTHPSPRAAHGAPGAPTAVDPKLVADKLADAEATFNEMRPELDKIDPRLIVPLKGDGQLAAIAALGVALMIEQPAVRRRFEAVVSIKELDQVHLDRLLKMALALWYARHRYNLVLATTSNAKLPAKLEKDTKEQHDRMIACASYYLSKDENEGPALAEIIPGTSKADRANDLMGLAGIYQRNRDKLKHDTMHWRDTDEADARSNAVKILAALGLVPTPGGDDWLDISQRAYTAVASHYGEVSAVGRMLFRNDSPDALFPNLVASSRTPRGPAAPPVPPTGDAAPPGAAGPAKTG